MTKAIIPAVGWYAVFSDGLDLHVHAASTHREPLACWALDEQGDIQGMVVANGFVSTVEDVKNFVTYVYAPNCGT